MFSHLFLVEENLDHDDQEKMLLLHNPISSIWIRDIFDAYIDFLKLVC